MSHAIQIEISEIQEFVVLGLSVEHVDVMVEMTDAQVDRLIRDLSQVREDRLMRGPSDG